MVQTEKCKTEDTVVEDTKKSLIWKLDRDHYCLFIIIEYLFYLGLYTFVLS